MMKKIFLLGDSIRQGYDEYVEKSMEKVAKVYYVNDNARFAAYTLRYLHEWKNELKLDNIDAVHWNVGLWDTLRLKGDDIFTKPDVFADYIGRIERRIELLFPNAKVIYATSTPVNEDAFDVNVAVRYNKDIEKYNSIAIDVLSHYNVAINDLYTLMKDAPLSDYSDMTHFYTPSGTEKIGGQVNIVLCETLNIDISRLTIPFKTKFETLSSHNAVGQ